MQHLFALSGDLVLNIEIGIALIVLSLQYYYFVHTKNNIKKFKKIFPSHDLDESNIQTLSNDNQEVELINIEGNEYSADFTEIVNSTNKYLQKNRGAADFEIIKSIVQRNIEAFDENIISIINLPLYIGLMGTFTGVVTGLLNIAFRGGITESNINSFIGGVIIAMIASFMGLLLTVINNAGVYKNAKAFNEKRKNAFLNFLQIELMPFIGSGLANVVNIFKDNITKFNTSFGKNIKLFDEQLSGNIKSINESVSVIAKNVTPLIESTKSNYDILKELKSDEFQKMVTTNLLLYKIIADSVPKLVEFIKNQEELNNSVEKTVKFVSIIESVMNRVKNFEAGINALGDRIDNADYMGSDLIAKVNRKLEELDNQFELLKQHSQYAKGEIELHFIAEKVKIESLSAKILNDLQRALNFEIESNPLIKLNLLDNINEQIKEINKKIISNSEIRQVELNSAEDLMNYEGVQKTSFWNRINPFKH